MGMEPTILIRRAQMEDVESLCACLELAFESFRAKYTSDAFRDTVPSARAMRERMVHMVVYAAVATDGEIVGTIASAMEGDEAHLRGMAVLPVWHGRGIAEQLLRAAEKDLLAAGCVRITLDTTVPLQRAIRFYQRNGFVASGRVTDFFGMDLYEYVKVLGL